MLMIFQHLFSTNTYVLFLILGFMMRLIVAESKTRLGGARSLQWIELLFSLNTFYYLRKSRWNMEILCQCILSLWRIRRISWLSFWTERFGISLTILPILILDISLSFYFSLNVPPEDHLRRPFLVQFFAY